MESYSACDLASVDIFPTAAIFSIGIPAALMFGVLPHRPFNLSVVFQIPCVETLPADILSGVPQ